MEVFLLYAVMKPYNVWMLQFSAYSCLSFQLLEVYKNRCVHFESMRGFFIRWKRFKRKSTFIVIPHMYNVYRTEYVINFGRWAVVNNGEKRNSTTTTIETKRNKRKKTKFSLFKIIIIQTLNNKNNKEQHNRKIRLLSHRKASIDRLNKQCRLVFGGLCTCVCIYVCACMCVCVTSKRHVFHSSIDKMAFVCKQPIPKQGRYNKMLTHWLYILLYNCYRK